MTDSPPKLFTLHHLIAVTGTGRSGTKWISRILSRIGFRAYHEGCFTPDGLDQIPGRPTIDVSWLAVPWLYENEGTEFASSLRVVHVIRNPRHVIGSFLSARVFEVDDPYRRAIGKVIDLTGNPMVDACTWWLVANRIAARNAAIPTIRVEDFSLDDIDRICHLAQVNLPESMAVDGFVHVGSRDENKAGRRGGAPRTVEWDEMPKKLGKLIRDEAEKYGYN